MGKRLSKENVVEEIKKKIDDDYELLDFDYKNYETNICIKHKCGNIIERKFKIIKDSKHIICDKCQNKHPRNIHSGIKYDLNEVKKYLISIGCEYLDGEYINNKSILHIKCHCGINDYYRSFKDIKRGRINCKVCAKEKVLLTLTKHSVDDIEKDIKKNGYQIIDKSKYVNAYVGLPCRCSNGHTFDLYYSDYLCRGRGCRKCGILNNSGENHWNYKGGESEVMDALRKSLVNWKKDVLAYYGFECAIRKTKGDIVVHHLYSFSDLLKDALSICNLELLNKVSDYKDGEFDLLKSTLLSLHKRENGIAISKDIHNEFHSIYGKGNNTYEQFSNFLKDSYHLCLDEIVSDKSILYEG